MSIAPCGGLRQIEDGGGAGMAGAIFLPGKRTNLAFLLTQIALYPLLDILGIMGSGE